MKRLALSFSLFFYSVLVISGQPLLANASRAPTLGTDFKKASALYSEVLTRIHDSYFQKVNLIECSQKILIGGVPACTDPNSDYFKQDEAESWKEQMEGEYGGIGISLEAKQFEGGWKFVAVAVFENTPAYAADLRPGDVLVAVSTASAASKISLNGKSLREVTGLIKGLVGTQITIYVSRDNQLLEFILTRAKIQVPSVTYRKISPAIGYLKIVEFNAKADFQFFLAVDSMTASGMRALIIDVRNNPGGFLGVCLGIIDSFAGNSEILLWEVGREGEEVIRSSLLSSIFNQNIKLKVVVLANENSASASEILAGWFREDFGAPVVGNKTFGKGSIQRMFALSDKSELKLTTAEYLVGKNRLKVHGQGVEPTIKVENPKEVKSESGDLQLKRALEEAEKLLKE